MQWSNVRRAAAISTLLLGLLLQQLFAAALEEEAAAETVESGDLRGPLQILREDGLPALWNNEVWHAIAEVPGRVFQGLKQLKGKKKGVGKLVVDGKDYLCGAFDFREVKHLGGGLFGEAFLVEHVFTQRIYVRKTIPKGATGDHMKNSAAGEMDIMRTVSPHPFIVNYYCHYEDANAYNILMEYCEGGPIVLSRRRWRSRDHVTLPIPRGLGGFDSVSSLSNCSQTLHSAPPSTFTSSSRSRSLRGYYIPRDTFILLAAELAIAIEHFHRKGYVHNDIHLGNVFLSGDDHVRLADFGLSKPADKPLPSGKRYRRTMCAYCPPEFHADIADEEIYGRSADVYMFGILLFGMRYNANPYEKYDTPCITTLSSYAALTLTPPVLDENDDADALILSLIDKFPRRRLAAFTAIRKHPLFSGLSWEAVERGEYPLGILSEHRGFPRAASAA